MRCLERDPAHRYQHADQIVADIDAHRSPSKVRSHHTVSINIPLPTPRGWLYAAIAMAAIVGLLAVPPVRQFVFRSSTTTAGIPSAAAKKLIAVRRSARSDRRRDSSTSADGLAEALSARLFGRARCLAPAARRRIMKLIARIGAKRDVATPRHGTVPVDSQRSRPMSMGRWPNGAWGPDSLPGSQGSADPSGSDLCRIGRGAGGHAVNRRAGSRCVAADEQHRCLRSLPEGRNAMRSQQDNRNVESR